MSDQVFCKTHSCFTELKVYTFENINSVINNMFYSYFKLSCMFDLCVIIANAKLP